MDNAAPSGLPAPTIRIFADFDGTISPRDVGDGLFRMLCGVDAYESIIEKWSAGELSGIEMYARLSAAAAPLTASMLDEFLVDFDIDTAFPGFVSWCAQNSYPLTVLSDGFDAYIERMFARHGIVLPLRCNRLLLSDDGMAMEFPYVDERCPRLANCKSNHVALLSRDEDLVVYIGDGRSDFEAAALADMVFARGLLETHCQEENITFRRFSSFNDIRIVLSGLISQGKLRRRKRAEVLRRQLWASG